MNKTEQRWIEIDQKMKRYDVEPEGLIDYIERTRPQYLFYSKKKKRAYCSVCGESFAPDKGLRHNNETVCPKCGATVIAKSEGYVNAFQDICWTMWAQNDGDDICLHYYRTVANYGEDFRHPDIETTEQYRDVFGEDYKSYMWWHSNVIGNTSRERWLPYSRRGFWYNSYTSVYYEPHNVRVIGDLSEAVKRSRLKYCPIDGFLNYRGRQPDGSIAGCMANYWLANYRACPQIEYVFKVGFKKLTSSVAAREMRLKAGNNICDVLGITKQQFKRLVAIGDPTQMEYEMIRDFDCTIEEARWLITYLSSRGKIKKLIKVVPLAKLVPYLKSINNDIQSYSDYVEWLENLDYEMNKYNLFPKDFWKAHDRLMEIYYNERDKAKNEEIAAIANNVNLEMHLNGLFIRPARSATELRLEGSTLHHCVATYAERMARGQTLIMFIRKEAEPDKPFYTMEVRDGKIIQLRGMRNCEPTPEVAEFRTEFEKLLKRPAEKKAA